MTRDVAIKILSRHNRWLNGDDEAKQPQILVQEAIDFAVVDMMVTNVYSFQLN